MTQQNQSPVVTDEELIRRARAHLSRATQDWCDADTWLGDLCDRLEAITQPSGKVSDEQVERAMKAWFKDDYQNGMVMGVAATLDIHGEMRAALEAAQLPARPAVKALEWYGEQASAAQRYMVDKESNAYALLAILTSLALDGGKRALSALEGEGK